MRLIIYELQNKIGSTKISPPKKLIYTIFFPKKIEHSAFSLLQGEMVSIRNVRRATREVGGNARVRNVGGRQKGLSRRGRPALAGGVDAFNSTK